MSPVSTASNTHVLDAAGARLGRIATAAATILMGKQSAGFTKNLLSKQSVSIVNASRLDLSLRKRAQKQYIRHSGYPGGQKIETLEKLLARRGSSEIVRRAVYGMLPKNKLRERMMKFLSVSE